MTLPRMMKPPRAFLPVAMSLAALTTVPGISAAVILGHPAGQRPSPDFLTPGELMADPGAVVVSEPPMARFQSRSAFVLGGNKPEPRMRIAAQERLFSSGDTPLLTKG